MNKKLTTFFAAVLFGLITASISKGNDRGMLNSSNTNAEKIPSISELRKRVEIALAPQRPFVATMNETVFLAKSTVPIQQKVFTVNSTPDGWFKATAEQETTNKLTPTIVFSINPLAAVRRLEQGGATGVRDPSDKSSIQVSGPISSEFSVTLWIDAKNWRVSREVLSRAGNRLLDSTFEYSSWSLGGTVPTRIETVSHNGRRVVHELKNHQAL